MPSIGLRLGAGAGMAAGLQRAREIKTQRQQIQYDEDEHEYAQEQREKAGQEERASHAWYDDEYEALGGGEDETKFEAYRQLPLEVKTSVLKQRQAERGIKTMMRRAGTDLQRLSANPRFAKDAQSIQERLQGDPLSVDIEAVSKEIEDLSEQAAKIERLGFKGERVMQEAQEWMGTVQRPDEYDMGKVFTSLSRLQSELESSQDPNMEPMTQEDLEDLEYDLAQAQIPVKVKDRMDAEASQRMLAMIDQTFMESLGEDYETVERVRTGTGPDGEAEWGGTLAPKKQDPERARSLQEMGPGGDEFTRVLGQVKAQGGPEAGAEQAPGGQGADPRLPTQEMMEGQTTGADQKQTADGPQADQKQTAGKPQRVVVPWKSPLKEGERRSIKDAWQGGEVYNRLLTDLRALLESGDVAGAEAAGKAAGLKFDAELKKRLNTWKPGGQHKQGDYAFDTQNKGNPWK